MTTTSATPSSNGKRIPFARAASVGTALLAVLAPGAHADAITDWNIKSGEILMESKMGTPPAIRVMAIVQTAAYEAASRVDARKASLDAAVAAAHRATLGKLVGGQQAAVDAAYQAAIQAIPEGPQRTAGIAVGERAAAKALAAGASDGAAAAETYRPHAAPGAYVPTAIPAAVPWPQRKPWLMASAAQFRPAPPPALASDTWVRHYNEVKAYGGKADSQRSAEQTEVARFWEFSQPSIYHGLVRSVALQPGRDPVRNAWLFAVVAQAMDDAMIAVFDAKYHYNFWRPVTAIRNGDTDGNDATQRDPAWASFIDTPLHPEYPSAHSILAASVGAVLQAEAGQAALPPLSTASPSAKGAVRRWSSIDAFVSEVAEARISGGMHYRFSTEVGAAMGRQIGALAAQRLLAARQ
ncbi:vanadium-dependent haloperoxidase [Ottowia sp.]|jgi:membrane-associated phospholipid phosphatase|uniref:vanadium-dependent haloperoxidase n=1 Tax=Ottowia sp. TaxID=1898956 RepID=UPI0025E2AEA8|nr:vanadium-dependent haloperoxidase [Ottowia sp.]MBK6615826.1 vanadium-dependent haloperoxidase [Ottowia sp.]